VDSGNGAPSPLMQTRDCCIHGVQSCRDSLAAGIAAPRKAGLFPVLIEEYDFPDIAARTRLLNRPHVPNPHNEHGVQPFVFRKQIARLDHGTPKQSLVGRGIVTEIFDRFTCRHNFQTVHNASRGRHRAAWSWRAGATRLSRSWACTVTDGQTLTHEDVGARLNKHLTGKQPPRRCSVAGPRKLQTISNASLTLS
jgi:hypothetical protein